MESGLFTSLGSRNTLTLRRGSHENYLHGGFRVWGKGSRNTLTPRRHVEVQMKTIHIYIHRAKSLEIVTNGQRDLATDCCKSTMYILKIRCLVFVCVFVCLFVCLSVCLFVYLLVCLSVCLFVCVFACLCICLFLYLLVCFLACLFVYLLVCLSVCLFVCVFAQAFRQQTLECDQVCDDAPGGIHPWPSPCPL